MQRFADKIRDLWKTLHRIKHPSPSTEAAALYSRTVSNVFFLCADEGFPVLHGNCFAFTEEAVPIISKEEWKILKWHCLLAPGFNLLMFSIPMVPVHSSTLLQSVASGSRSPVLHCPNTGRFSSTGDTSLSEATSTSQQELSVHLPKDKVFASSKAQLPV